MAASRQASGSTPPALGLRQQTQIHAGHVIDLS